MNGFPGNGLGNSMAGAVHAVPSVSLSSILRACQPSGVSRPHRAALHLCPTPRAPLFKGTRRGKWVSLPTSLQLGLWHRDPASEARERFSHTIPSVPGDQIFLSPLHLLTRGMKEESQMESEAPSTLTWRLGFEGCFHSLQLEFVLNSPEPSNAGF